MAREESTDTVVVGASAAGLAVAACLRRAGVPFVLLEQTARVGSAWRNHYDRLHLHTPRSLSSLPHLGFPAGTPRYPSRDQVVDYLERYAAHFEITPRFGQRVVEIAPQPAGDGWRVRTEDTVLHAHRVVMATGVNRVPHLPEWPGSDRFGGPILHSCLYRNTDGFRGKRVLVVGMGNSGAEIALDLCDGGADVGLAVRSPVNVIPRDFLGLSIVLWAVALSVLPARVADAVGRLVSRLAFGPLARLGLRPLPHGPVLQIQRQHSYPVLDVGTVTRIRQGRIRVLPGLRSFAPGRVQFNDGRELPFDAVVLATGYRAELGALLAPGLDVLQSDDGLPVASGRALLPGLYFCGFHPTETGGLREMGREAKRIARSIVRARAVSPRQRATATRSPALSPAAAPPAAAASRTDR